MLNVRPNLKNSLQMLGVRIRRKVGLRPRTCWERPLLTTSWKVTHCVPKRFSIAVLAQTAMRLIPRSFWSLLTWALSYLMAQLKTNKLEKRMKTKKLEKRMKAKRLTFYQQWLQGKKWRQSLRQCGRPLVASQWIQPGDSLLMLTL